MSKRKRESQKQLKEMYKNLERYASGINNPDNTHRKNRGRNGQQNRESLHPVSRFVALQPLDRRKQSE